MKSVPSLRIKKYDTCLQSADTYIEIYLLFDCKLKTANFFNMMSKIVGNR